MSYLNVFIDGVVRVRPGRKPGAYGGWVDDWTNPVLEPVGARCSVQPETTREIRDGSDRIIIHAAWKLITQPPHTIELEPGDRVRVPGLAHDLTVVGEPQQWTQLRPHTEVTLEAYYG